MRHQLSALACGRPRSAREIMRLAPPSFVAGAKGEREPNPAKKPVIPGVVRFSDAGSIPAVSTRNALVKIDLNKGVCLSRHTECYDFRDRIGQMQLSI
jgi:hypothetical protein